MIKLHTATVALALATALGLTACDSKSGGGSDSYTMPDEKGMVLQDAQDTIQSVTDNPLYYTDSKDATGQSRMQILDRDWKVCGQYPKAGKRFTDDDPVTFFVVKLAERCG